MPKGRKARNRKPVVARPVKGRVKDYKRYEAEMRKKYLRPLLNGLSRRMGTAENAIEAGRAAAEAINSIMTLHNNGVPTHVVAENLERVRNHHRLATRRVIRSAIGVDVALLLSEPPVAEFMRRKIAENVDLIKTIPERLKVSLTKRMRQEFETAPFDKARLRELLREEYQSSGYNLTRITRDQTSKIIGQLTEIRQRQLGIPGYQWSDSGDSRVRPSHAANDGIFFLWSEPPATGAPGSEFLCRCSALATITPEHADRLRGAVRAGGATPVGI